SPQGSPALTACGEYFLPNWMSVDTTCFPILMVFGIRNSLRNFASSRFVLGFLRTLTTTQSCAVGPLLVHFWPISIPTTFSRPYLSPLFLGALWAADHCSLPLNTLSMIHCWAARSAAGTSIEGVRKTLCFFFTRICALTLLTDRSISR